MKLIVGLGNPGKKYLQTRHNVGFQTVTYLSHAHNISIDTNRFQSLYGRVSLYGHSILIAKPQTYMNLSGAAVGALARYYKIPPSHILVIHDDMDIDFGRFKIKIHGSSAGHRGIESIITALNSSDFLRIRVGIGKPISHIDPVDFVLQPFTLEEQTIISGVFKNIDECICLLLTQGVEPAMNRFHGQNSIKSSEQ